MEYIDKEQGIVKYEAPVREPRDYTRIDLGASAWHRWSTCPGSVGFIIDNADRIPEEQPSKYADIGSHAHLYCEQMLLLGVSLYAPPEGMEQVCDCYIQYVENQPGDLFVEQKLPLPYLPERNTIGDSIRWDSSNKTLYVNDLKTGFRPVDSEDNFQLLIGAAAAISHFGFKPEQLSMTIVQPTVSHDPVSWEIDIDEFRQHYRLISAHAEYIKTSVESKRPLPLVPSSHGCRYCPARNLCPANLDTQLLYLATQHPSTLRPIDVSRIAANAKRLKDSVDSVAQYALEAHLQGRPDVAPNLMLVDGRRPALSWVDEDTAKFEVVKLLGDEGFAPRKLITATQATKLFAQKGLDPEVVKALTCRGEPSKKLIPTTGTDLSELADLGNEDSPFAPLD